MRRSVVTILVLLVIAAGAVIAVSTQSGSDKANTSDIDRILRDAVLTDFAGNEYTLQDFEGKTVLVDIWETWCTPCLQSFPTLQQLMEDYPDDFVVLAVSPGYMDSPDQVREFVENHDYDFEFLFGEELTRELGVQSIPYKVYVSPNGEHVASITGTQGPEEDYEKTREIIEEYL